MQDGKRRKLDEKDRDCDTAMTRPQHEEADDTLAAFVRAYNDENAPACILSIGSSDGRSHATITASNAAFADSHKHQLIAASSSLQQEKVLLTGDIRWSITAVPAAADRQSFVCLGRRQGSAARKVDAFPASGTSQNEQVCAEYAETKQPQHYSSGTGSAEDWLQCWSKLDTPGIDRKAFRDHLDLIRKVDWSKTPLGPMDTWSTVLLSTLGQCLASPFPVLLAWGPELTQIYNLPYSYNIAHKHPANLGKAYRDAWPEVWEHLASPTSDALKGKATHVNNAQMFLQRRDYLEECYFTWSMSPIFDDDREIVGIYIPNFDNTLAVVTERRLRLLREASQATGVETKPAELYDRICKATSRESMDLPLLVFYDSSAADEERETSEASSEIMLEVQSQADSNAQDDIFSAYQQKQRLGQVQSPLPPKPQNGIGATLHRSPSPGAGPSGESEGPHDAPKGVDQDRSAMSNEEVHKVAKPLSNLVRAACSGCGDDSKLFPSTIPPPNEDNDKSIATHPVFLQALRKVQNTHQHVILYKEDMKDFIEYVDKTSLGDDISTIVIVPITTSDDTVRGICIVGLNPRKAYSDDYQVFLDLFQAQLNHGVTSIRLVGEELRRSRFFAALIKRKNEELHVVLDARTEELRNSEQKFVKMAEICPSAIWTVDPNGKVTFVSKAWHGITGHSLDRPVDEWPDTIHPEDKDRCLVWFEKVLTTRDPIHALEFRWKQRPGETKQRWTWADARHDIDDNGVLVGVTGTLTDITEKKMVELHQQQRAEEAIQMRRAQEGFVDMTSHELRNLSSEATTERLEHLLNTGSAKILMTMYKTEVEDTLQDMKIINHCCMHMTRLIDDVLTLSKLDNQFLVVTPVPCRPADFISETLSIFKGEMSSKDITYELEIKPSFVANKVDYVLTDPSRINQLVINILTNAIKFTATAKVRQIKVVLDCSPTKPTTAGTSMQPTSAKLTEEGTKPAHEDELYLLVSISDTGRGLTQDEIGHLFQRFRQANPKTHISYGGSGLGLHICKRIAELLGGEIGVESVRGRGSTFTFYIPTKRTSIPHSSRLAPSPGFTTLAGHSTEDPLNRALTGEGYRSQQPLSSPAEELGNVFEKLSLLIVEDNLINQRLLDKHLTRVGCVTACANHGQEAIDLVKQSKWVRSDGPTIDCILMDIEMPVMDGLAAIQELRRMQASGEITGHIPVLAVTANAREEQLETMLGSGFDGTISKPFKIPVIMERVRTLLRELRHHPKRNK